MNDKTDVTSAESEQNRQPEQEPPGKRKSTKFWLWGLLGVNTLLVVVLLAIIIALGVWFNQHQQGLEKTVLKLQNQQDQLQKVNDSQQQKLTALRHQLQQIEAKQSSDKSQWLLAKVKYLTRLASYNLHFLHDVTSTRTLLQSAKAQLDDQAPAQYVKLRSQLQQYIDQLDQVNQDQISDIVLKLDSISQSVTKLPLRTVASEDQKQLKGPNKKDNASKNQASKWWDTIWQQSRRALTQAVTIRYNQNDVKPLIAPEANAYLVSNVQTKLYQAQWAAMRYKTQMYHKQLRLVQKWIEQYFDTDQKQTQSVIQRIRHLRQLTISPELPDMKQLIQAVNKAQQQHINNAQATD